MFDTVRVGKGRPNMVGIFILFLDAGFLFSFLLFSSFGFKCLGC